MDRPDQNQFAQKLKALKQVFSTSLNCFTRTLNIDEGGSRDEGEYHAVTIFNRHTRDSVDLNAVGGFSATEIHKFSITSTSGPQRSQRLKAFWRQKVKKPSPFFQEHIGETKERISEGITVLANEHADESVTLRTCPETEVKRLSPEMLTVSVDVTAVTLEVKGCDEDSEASKTPSHVSNDMKVMAGPAENLCSSSSSGEIQMIPKSLEDSCIAQSSTVSRSHVHSQKVDNLHQQQSINTPKVSSKRTASEHPAGRVEIRLNAAFDSDSFSVHRNAAAENGIGPSGNKIPAGPATGDAAVLPVTTVRSEQNAEQRCEKRELFLLGTACPVQ